MRKFLRLRLSLLWLVLAVAACAVALVFHRLYATARDEIAALQRTRMAWSMRHAYENVPHYRASFDAAGVHPDDFRELADLAKFPFTTKQDLRANYPFGMFAVPREKVARIHASSGTTGKPTVVGYTLKDIDTWAHLAARSIYAAGGRPGMAVHVAYGYGLFTGGLGITFRIILLPRRPERSAQNGP